MRAPGRLRARVLLACSRAGVLTLRSGSAGAQPRRVQARAGARRWRAGFGWLTRTSVTRPHAPQAAIFNFTSWLMMILLFICSCAFVHRKWTYKFGDPQTQGVSGIWWKAARVGERLSPW